jgi:hypothetical protein
MIAGVGTAIANGGNMFGRDKLVEDGVEARGVIVDATPGNLLNSHGERKWHVRVRVKFEDGQTTESDCEVFDLGIGAVGPASGVEPYPLAAGTVIPVRSDQKDRSRVTIDRPKMISETRAAYEADREKKVAKAEASLAPAPAGDRENDENYLMDALAAAQTRGDVTEAQRLTQRLEELIQASGSTSA